MDALAQLPPPFDEALRRHEAEIMRFLVRTTRDHDDALDLFQETWLRAYRAYPSLDSAAGLRPWLYRIAANLCLNRTRSRIRRSRVIADDPPLDEIHVSASASHTNAASPDGVIHLRDAIERLPRKQRAALIMRKFGGLGYDEIAVVLECSCESARAGVYQALKKLKAILE
ncbi:MAG TPA: RNA polymerase sigma factor [Candidatus Binataceae bacterium]|nr:RNA polymerase sigma factor [Candidatus Binataceae bacterium]